MEGRKIQAHKVAEGFSGLWIVGPEERMQVVSGLEAIMPLHPTARMRWASNKILRIGVGHAE